MNEEIPLYPAPTSTDDKLLLFPCNKQLAIMSALTNERRLVWLLLVKLNKGLIDSESNVHLYRGEETY